MIQILRKQDCCGCTACYSSCPNNAITMVRDNEGFVYPNIDLDRCVDCGLCEKACPFRNTEEKHVDTNSYAAINTDNNRRAMSSSGGIFTLLAEEILNQHGVIFGAAFSPDYKTVSHICVESFLDLDQLLSSKYLQSEMKDAYQKVKALLNDGRMVLFSGVPCQICGLKNYLGRDYDNLICVEVFCHGVPSPSIWQGYLTNLEKKYNGQVSFVNFREKNVLFNKVKKDAELRQVELFIPKDESIYMGAFLKNYSMRPSCYDCKVKTVESNADISIGDLWGAIIIVPDMADKNGVSAVVVHTPKGQLLYDAITSKVKSKMIEYESVKKYNGVLHASSPCPEDRDGFFSDVFNVSADELCNKYQLLGIKSIKNTIKHGRVYKVFNRVRNPKYLNYGLHIKINR